MADTSGFLPTNRYVVPGVGVANPDAAQMSGLQKAAMIFGSGNLWKGLNQVNQLETLNKQYQRQLQEEAMTRQQRGQAYGNADKRFSGLGYLTPEEANLMMQRTGDADFGNAARSHEQGQYADYGLAPAAQVQAASGDILKQEGQNSQSQDFQNQAFPTIQQGQQASQINGGFLSPRQPNGGGFIQGGLQGGNGQPIPDTGSSAPQSFGNNGGPIQAGASMQGMNPPSVLPQFRARATPEQMMPTITAGLEDAQKGGVLRETAQHNRVEEGIKRDIYNATKDNLGGYAKYAPIPNANPYTVPNAEQNYLKSQLNAVDQQLGGLGVNTHLAKWNPLHHGLENQPEQASQGGWFGIGKVTPEQAANNHQINQLQEKRNQILSRMNGVPFGGNSQQKIENENSNFSQWQQNRKR